MRILDKYIEIVEAFQERLGSISAWMSTALVLLVIFDVVMRYVFNITFVAAQELEWHIFAALFLLGAGYTLKHGEHVRIDITYAKLSPKRKAIVDFFGTLFFLIPFCLIVIWSSFTFVSLSFTMGESSPDGGGLPARYILKAIIPIAYFILLLQGFVMLIKSYRAMKAPASPAGAAEPQSGVHA